MNTCVMMVSPNKNKPNERQDEMDETTKKKVLSIIDNIEKRAGNAESDFAREMLSGEFRGVLKAMWAMGFEVVYDDDYNVVDIVEA